MTESVVEEDWVVVKKQRIIILVPPPSPVKKSEGHNKNYRKTKSARRVGKTLVTSKRRKLLSGTGSKLSRKHLDNEVHKDGELEKHDPDHAEHETQDNVGRTNCRRLGYSRSSKLSEGSSRKPAARLPEREMQSAGEIGKHALNHAETHENAGRLIHGKTGTSKNSMKLSEKINHMSNAALSERKDELEKPVRNHSKIAAPDGVRGLLYQNPASNYVPPLENGIKHNGQRLELPQSSCQHVPQTHVSTYGALVTCHKRKIISSPERFDKIAKLPVGRSNIAIQKMRAVNLQRRLHMLGGLQNWLLSQRLAQFIKIFQREKLGVYHLVTLTMSKLKEMGADPVGPRRKLLNAIDSLCQPCYLKRSQ